MTNPGFLWFCIWYFLTKCYYQYCTWTIVQLYELDFSSTTWTGITVATAVWCAHTLVMLSARQHENTRFTREYFVLQQLTVWCVALALVRTLVDHTTVLTPFFFFFKCVRHYAVNCKTMQIAAPLKTTLYHPVYTLESEYLYSHSNQVLYMSACVQDACVLSFSLCVIVCLCGVCVCE